jgi:hypothetical protein
MTTKLFSRQADKVRSAISDYMFILGIINEAKISTFLMAPLDLTTGESYNYSSKASVKGLSLKIFNGEILQDSFPTVVVREEWSQERETVHYRDRDDKRETDSLLRSVVRYDIQEGSIPISEVPQCVQTLLGKYQAESVEKAATYAVKWRLDQLEEAAEVLYDAMGAITEVAEEDYDDYLNLLQLPIERGVLDEDVIELGLDAKEIQSS